MPYIRFAEVDRVQIFACEKRPSAAAHRGYIEATAGTKAAVLLSSREHQG